MNKKLFTYALLPMLGLGILGAGTASAHGFFMMNAAPEEIASRQQAMFEANAKLLGVSVDDVKNAWASGKTLRELAEEKGITEEQLKQKVKDARLLELKSQLQTLVEKGVITQAQADQRLQVMQKNVSDGKRHRGMGFRHIFGF